MIFLPDGWSEVLSRFILKPQSGWLAERISRSEILEQVQEVDWVMAAGIPEYILVVGIVLISTFVRGAVGFGNALIAMPLLTMVIGVRSAAPLVALLGLATAVLMLIREWQQLDFRAAGHLIAAAIPGIPVGLLFLTTAPEHLVKGLLGVVLIGFGSYNLFNPRLPQARSPRWGWLFGFMAGILGGAYNSDGPPVVIYGVMRRWKPDRFRATLQGYFLIAGAAIAAGHGLSGLWTHRVLLNLVVSLPAVLVGVLAGDRASDGLPDRAFHRLVNGFLILVGVVLLI